MAQSDNNITKVTSPYNFVPLPKEGVFFPDWAEQISHDVPFADGVSGKIHLTLVAETPIFVRNGAASSADEKETSFSHYAAPDGSLRYFLPATTIKGQVRSVLEILSFGKMRLDERAMFAQREWDNTQLYELKTPKEQQKIRCGYLRRKGDDYEIADHGKPWRISQKEIDSMLGTDIFERYFCDKGNGKLTDEQKTAAYKYSLLEDLGLRPGQLTGLMFSAASNKNGKVVVKADPSGDMRGSIVLTGSPDRWKKIRGKDAGKFYEFVFPAKSVGIHALSSGTFDHYKFIYDRADENGKKEWARIRRLIEEPGADGGYPGAPVFFRVDDNGAVKDFGFALLYKLPYRRTPFETLRHDDKDGASRPDMADCVFGCISKTPGESLKGRVFFSNAFAKRAVPDEVVTVTPGSPKASYYPCYISQKGKAGKADGDYKTYNDNDGEIRGWKRYVLKNGATPGRRNDENDKVNVSFTPLKAGAEFECDVVFFNLRHVELGALLSALTFHGTPSVRHQIGGGKPYGYGRTRVEVGSVADADGNALDKAFFLGCFESLMEEFTSNNWLSSPTVRELLSMADKDVARSDSDFRYMSLSMDGNNDFADAKKSRLYLQSFTEIAGGKSSQIRSLRDIFEKETKKKLADRAAALQRELSSIELTDVDSLLPAADAVARIEREAEAVFKDFGGLKSEEASQTANDLANVKNSINSVIAHEMEKVDAMPHGTSDEIVAKRAALEKLRSLAEEAAAKLAMPMSVIAEWCGQQLGNLPKPLSGSVTDVVNFIKKGRFEKDITKWVKQKGPLTDEQAKVLNASFRKACEDPKIKKEFSGYRLSNSLKDLISSEIFDIIFKLD